MIFFKVKAMKYVGAFVTGMFFVIGAHAAGTNDLSAGASEPVLPGGVALSPAEKLRGNLARLAGKCRERRTHRLGNEWTRS